MPGLAYLRYRLLAANVNYAAARFLWLCGFRSAENWADIKQTSIEVRVLRGAVRKAEKRLADAECRGK